MSTATAALAVPRAGRGAVLMLLAGAAMLSFSGTLVKLSEVGPSATAFYRMSLSLPLLLLLMAAEGRTAPQPRRESRDWWLLVVAGLFLAGDLVAWHWALRITSVANATLLGNGAPIFVALASWLLFRERLTPSFLLGLALAVAGSATLVAGGARFDLREAAGDALGVVTGAFYAGYIMVLTRLRTRFSTGAALTGSGIVTALCALAAAALAGERLVPHSLHGWLVVAVLAVLCQGLAMGLIGRAMAHLPATLTSVCLLLAPVGAPVNAWWMLGEPLGPAQGIGGALVLAGILLARRGSTSTATPA
ncbi:MAG: DMT family transporter [Rhodospirillaceae bacterium]|nr:DMT family transporter [Rhodospirillaceae bacterium]